MDLDKDTHLPNLRARYKRSPKTLPVHSKGFSTSSASHTSPMSGTIDLETCSLGTETGCQGVLASARGKLISSRGVSSPAGLKTTIQGCIFLGNYKVPSVSL